MEQVERNEMINKTKIDLLLYAIFWVISPFLYFICRRFWTLCSIFIGGQV